MEQVGILVPSGTAGESYKTAKVEHYLRMAEDCFEMARFSAAGRFLDHALRLDPGNPEAAALKTRLDTKYSRFLRKSSQGQDGGGGRSQKSWRRDEVVLLVDQDERVLSRLASTLQRYGLSVVSASNRTEASEMLQAVVPDLVISEVNFEDGPSGLDLFLSLRSNPQTQRVPFMFLATRIDREMLIAGKRFGVDDFLRKPADEDVVAASVVNCLTRVRRTKST